MAAVERVEQEAAYVLHRRPYRDTSALVELLTAQRGRVGVVARGARRRKSRQAALLQPFQPLRASWLLRGELGTLTDVEAASGPMTLTGQRLVAGFYANELVMRLVVRHQPHPITFTRYATLIGQLAEGAAIGPSLRLFERDLLVEIGYGLTLSCDSQGRALEPEQIYRYDLEMGAYLVGSAEGPGVRLSGDALLALAGGTPHEGHDASLKQLMRSALRPYLGDQPLKSRELYAGYRRATPIESEESTDD